MEVAAVDGLNHDGVINRAPLGNSPLDQCDRSAACQGTCRGHAPRAAVHPQPSDQVDVPFTGRFHAHILVPYETVGLGRQEHIPMFVASSTTAGIFGPGMAVCAQPKDDL
ncbi:hypothetical protein TW95_gp0744 [Pandoravirus inopinatum]|uniref:Uncharacterized protein n=1 Tax=Pandoravirus inopinatum TaxID=1605721 RepID=A0A0B5IXI5_9VIRU|nr:hypothetical protein TW95_gp0744 [Pandoravirus inopinatum]AJF97478.1 hypothetical protein [Pandoravirus inopinatum]